MENFLRKVFSKVFLSRCILLFGAVIYLVFGLIFFINPDFITDMDGIILPTRSAANHIRAVLGGMEIGLGVLLIYFSFVKSGLKNGLIVLAATIGITSLTRLYGILFDGAADISNIISFAAEFAFGLIALILFCGFKNVNN